MKKFILLPLAFTIAITFFSFSCAATAIVPTAEVNLAVTSVSVTGTGATRTIRATTPSATEFGAEDPSQYSYVLHYVNTRLAYPDITDTAGTPSTDINDFLPKNGKELKESLPTLPSGSAISTGIAPGDPGAGVEIFFVITDLEANTLYLYVVETFHNVNANSYTSISDTSGSFATAPTTSLPDLAVTSVSVTGTGTTRTIQATTPSDATFGTEEDPSEYSYVLHYVNTRLAYPDIPSTDINDFLHITGKELKESLPLLPSGSAASTAIAPGDPGAGVEISFDISDLAGDTLYLYTVETFHNVKANHYTSISETNGWFATDLPQLMLFFTPITGTGTTRTLSIATPTLENFGSREPLEYRYTLHYVNTKLAYPDITSTDIAAFLHITGEELKNIGTPTAITQASSDPSNPGAFITVSFNLSNLVTDTIYLYTIEISHSTEAVASIYTNISQDRGWFDTTPPPFTLESSSVTDNAILDAKFYGLESTLTPQNGAQNISPALSWNKPAGANGFLIVMYDTYSGADNWIHWIRTESGATLSVAEGAGSFANPSNQYPTDSSDNAEYSGPQPPPDTGSHTYVIKIFALSNALSTLSGITSDSLKLLLDKTTGEAFFGTTIIDVSSISVNAAYLP